MIFSLPLIPLTNSVVTYLLMAVMIAVSVSVVAVQSAVVGNWWSLFTESLYRTLLLMTVDYIGKKFTLYFPIVYSVFHLVRRGLVLAYLLCGHVCATVITALLAIACQACQR